MTYDDQIIGRCWACGEPVRRSQIVRAKDGQGIARKLHRGICLDRFEVQNPAMMGGTMTKETDALDAMTPEEYKDLLDRLDHPPLAWVPQDKLPASMADLDAAQMVRSKAIFGQVDEIDDTRTTDYGSYRYVVIAQPDGTRIGVAGLGQVLAKRLAGVEIGDRLAIRYEGRKPSSVAGQADYHDYNVAVDRKA